MCAFSLESNIFTDDPHLSKTGDVGASPADT